LSREANFRRAQRLILAGLVVELLSLVGLYRPWGFLMFSMGGITLIGLGVVFYIASAVQPGTSD
jgi:hypothetical protein